MNIEVQVFMREHLGMNLEWILDFGGRSLMEDSGIYIVQSSGAEEGVNYCINNEETQALLQWRHWGAVGD